MLEAEQGISILRTRLIGNFSFFNLKPIQENHKATIVGDTVGDPFKDTSGPSLNILIKLMSMVSIVMAGLTVTFSLF